MKKKNNDFQGLLLSMFSWFHKFCTENGLRYYMIGGTMLGAVRHHGFIPWDDDIDIGMPRRDYEKLIALTKNMTHSRYVVECPRKDNLDFQYLYSKVYDTHTTLIENTRSKAKRGVYIDIFPLDGVGNTLQETRRNIKKFHNLMKLHLIITCDFRSGRKWYKNLPIILGRILSPLFISERSINNRINNLCRKYDFDKYYYVANVYGNWWDKEVMPLAYFGTPKLYDFETIKVFGVENPTKYLTTLYGDFMKLPPKEKQVSHHDYLHIDLDKSFLDV